MEYDIKNNKTIVIINNGMKLVSSHVFKAKVGTDFKKSHDSFNTFVTILIALSIYLNTSPIYMYKNLLSDSNKIENNTLLFQLLFYCIMFRETIN